MYERFQSLFRGPDRKNLLPPHEAARLVRDIQLDIFHYGVFGSDRPVARQESDRAVKLPMLLRYSPTLRQHMQTLIGILAEPREFTLVNGVSPRLANPEQGDVVYAQEGPNHVYYFAHHLTSTYVNSWASTLDTYARDEPSLHVAILQANNRKHAKWLVDYCYLEWGNQTSPRLISSSSVMPERILTLNFWYSPNRLNGEEILEEMPKSEFTSWFIKSVGMQESDRFRQFIFHVDGTRMAAAVERDNYFGNQREQCATYLREKGDYEFAVVEIGTVELEGHKHWIYTGSEQSGIQARDRQPSRAAVHQLVMTPGIG